MPVYACGLCIIRIIDAKTTIFRNIIMNKLMELYEWIYKTKKITHSVINIKYICTILIYIISLLTKNVFILWRDSL
ncbi:hypothetical protein F240042I4_11990 [Eisenbergiella tayi]